MKHRHLTHEGFTTAAIEDILSRGSMPDWAPLIREIYSSPFGEVAGKTLAVSRLVDVYGASKLFERLILAARKMPNAQTGVESGSSPE